MDQDTLRRWAPGWLRSAKRLLVSQNARQNARFELRRRVGQRPTSPSPLRTVMVICHGNICRSPFAERLLALQCPNLEVRSAGLHAREGKAAEPGALRTALKYSIDLSDHQAHLLNDDDVEWADWILAMEGHQVAAVEERFAAARPKASLIGDFLEQPPFLISDPWGQPDEVFEATFEKIRSGIGGLRDILSTGMKGDRDHR